MKDLGNRSLSAVFWGAGGSVFRILLQFATQIALARILGPQQYGLFAIGAIVISFSMFLSDVGIAYSLIQKDEVTEQDLRFVFTWQVVLGLLVTGVVTALSGPIALFFGDVEAAGVVAGLAVVCLIHALMAPAHNLLKRNLDHKRIQIANIIGYAGGYVLVGLPLAVYGAAVSALVAAWIVQALITTVILYSGVRHSLHPLFWFSGGRQIMQYGTTVLVTNVTNWIIGNIERVVIARYFASREIGLYSTAYNLLYGPASTLLAIVQPVFFSAASRIALDRELIARTYLALIALTAVVIMPVFASVSSIADTFVLALYGTKWVGAAELVTPLALAMPLYLFWGFTTSLLWLGGAPEREFKVQLPMAALWAVMSWLAAQHSVEAVAWVVLLLFALRYALMLTAARQLMPLPFNGLWRALRGGSLVAVACAIFAGALDGWLNARGLAALGRLMVDGALTTAFYFLLLTILPGVIPHECNDLLERLAARSPAQVAWWLRRLPAKE